LEDVQVHPESKRALAATLEPYAVPLREAMRLLGDKSHSTLYELLGRGQLNAVKDGVKTLITLESIRRYSAGLPPAKIKPPPPRSPHRQTPDRKRRTKS
jgi:hypothetical protein